ncbi:hypothetical protein D0C17_15240 [Vibrio cholerae]|nr:hypothetical protein [Vibrio cholerae]
MQLLWLSLVLMRYQPLRRALAKRRECVPRNHEWCRANQGSNSGSREVSENADPSSSVLACICPFVGSF